MCERKRPTESERMWDSVFAQVQCGGKNLKKMPAQGPIIEMTYMAVRAANPHILF